MHIPTIGECLAAWSLGGVIAVLSSIIYALTMKSFRDEFRQRRARDGTWFAIKGMMGSNADLNKKYRARP